VKTPLAGVFDKPEMLSAGQEPIMKTDITYDDTSVAARNLSAVTGSHRRTLDAIFRHPMAHNLEWDDVVGLIGKIGDAHERHSSEFVFEVDGHCHVMRKPHDKDLTGSEVMEVRHFLMQTGSSPEPSAQTAANPDPAAPSLMIVVDHHGAKIFQVDIASGDASEDVIRPYDPHHFLHHLAHKDQSRERGQRAPEEPAYYERIADAVAAAGKIIVVGHGKGKSNAAHHLTQYLKSHHRETYRRIVREIPMDLSAITTAQLLDLARQALRD
jgi:hypothetical protein